jgi:hypothetical protein
MSISQHKHAYIDERTINFPTLKITRGSKQREALAESYYPPVACREHEAVRPGAFPGRKERSEGISLIAYQPPPK